MWSVFPLLPVQPSSIKRLHTYLQLRREQCGSLVALKNIFVHAQNVKNVSWSCLNKSFHYYIPYTFHPVFLWFILVWYHLYEITENITEKIVRIYCTCSWEYEIKSTYCVYADTQHNMTQEKLLEVSPSTRSNHATVMWSLWYRK